MSDGTELRLTAATWLPASTLSAADAVAAGRVSADEARAVGYLELPVATDLAPPEMAVRAGRRALSRAKLAPEALGLVAHAWTYHQGHDFWSPAHYVARFVGATGAVPVGIQQMCNGGAAALDVAVARLRSDASPAAALVTTADRFCRPGFDRWRGDSSLWYGDGATAMVVHRPDVARGDFVLLAMVTTAAADMEWMHRGRDAFSPAARWSGAAIDVRRTKRAFLDGVGKADFARRVADNVGAVVEQALTRAGVAPDSPRLRFLAMPRLGRAALEKVYEPAVAGLTKAEVLDLGRRTGHLGAGDLPANLAALAAEPMLAPGDIALVLSAGAGFTWSCLVVRRPGA